MGIFKEFFFLNFKDYENIKINFPIGMILIALTLAISAAAFIITYHKIYISTLLKRLIRFGATDESGAKTLSDLGLSNIGALRSSLSRSGQLTFMVKRRGAEDITYEEYTTRIKTKGYKEEKINFETAEFYIAPDKLDRAKKTVETDSTSWLRPIILSAVLVALLIVFAIFAPEILSLLNNYLK